MEVTINLLEDVVKAFSANVENIEREVLEATELEGDREGKLSVAQIGRMLALSRFEVDEFLKAHNVPADYSIADLEQDRRTLDKLFTK